VRLSAQLLGGGKAMSPIEFEHESSPLSVMDYVVGEKGGTPLRRREILRSAIEDQWSPRVRRAVPPDQLEEWGSPGPDRYRKLVAKLSSQIEIFRARKDRYRVIDAIREWEDDLRWIRETFGEEYGGL
jgi:hypothetical protein